MNDRRLGKIKVTTEGRDFISKVKMRIAHILCTHSPRFAQKIANLGLIADYMLFIQKSFPSLDSKTQFTRDRESTWKQMVQSSKKFDKLLILEFGVAHGYLSKSLISFLADAGYKSKSEGEKRYYFHLGFDLFTGLPRSFRQYPAGYFATEGGTPPMVDGANYVKGDVIKTLGSSVLTPELISKFDSVLCFFDMDLYEPTKFALQTLVPHLPVGTLLYFDELFDFEERRALLDVLQLESVSLFSYTLTSGTVRLETD